MPPLTWQGIIDDFDPVAMTVRAQSVPLNDNGRGGLLLFDAFFPKREVNSIRLRTITSLDWRPVADRREWNQRGRAIPRRMPRIADIEMVPVESYYKLDEYEMQRLVEQTGGNADQIRALIEADLPDRITGQMGLAIANNRRLEVDAFTAWALGQVTARDPQTGTTTTVSFGFDAARYTTAGTTWAAAPNAYQAMMTWLRDSAQNLIGPVEGIVLRQATLNAVLEDAPNILTNISGIQPTRSQVEQRVQDELGSAFRFVVMEGQEDIFTGAGLETARTKVWPAQVVAAIPAGGVVGSTMVAPTVRGYELANAAPQARINVRGQVVYVTTSNGGREATVECQINGLPVPDEQRVAVINVGV